MYGFAVTGSDRMNAIKIAFFVKKTHISLNIVRMKELIVK